MKKLLIIFLFLTPFVSYASEISTETATTNTFSVTTDGTETITVWARLTCDDCSSNDTIRLVYNGNVVDSMTVDTDSAGDNAIPMLMYTATPPAQTANFTISTVGGFQTLSDVRYILMRNSPSSDSGSSAIDMTYEMVFYGFVLFFLTLYFIVWYFRGKNI